MAIKPILFNGEMIRGIQEGRKTVTRRVVKFPENKYTGKIPDADGVFVYANTLYSDKVSFHEDPFYCFDVKPPYKIGDILYVREKWCKDANFEDFYYAAKREKGANAPYGLKWHPSIHMPKVAARIWLKVTDVRVERLQDITEQQAEAEGVYKGWSLTSKSSMASTARQAFMWVWDMTVKKNEHSFLGNPWVWVIKFERCEKAVDI